MEVDFDRALPTECWICAILRSADALGKAESVARHLVRASLAMCSGAKALDGGRSQALAVRNSHWGDLEVGNTVFHVTFAPMPELFSKCRDNLDRGLRVYLLVPDSQVVGAKQNAQLHAEGRITVGSIEAFIATNIDELSEFDGEKLVSGFRRLLETYNRRVDAVELDKSMLIEIPPNLD